MTYSSKKIIVLGASGSIGKSTVDIIKQFPDRFELVGFSVHSNLQYASLLKKYFPKSQLLVTSTDKNLSCADFYGYDCMQEFLHSVDADIVVNGISGAFGLRPSIYALTAGKDLALANKESLVMAGGILKLLAKKHNVSIIPVDSEHSAIFYLLNAHGVENLDKIIITASGGPFRNMPLNKLNSISVDDALKHPTWNMGGKITIDSASLANKALEVMEAVQLFDVSTDKIIVTVHPESVVHSLVQLKNGEVYAQMSPPDMRYPILSALSFPEIAPPYVHALDFSKSFDLHFEPPKTDVFPLLSIGFRCAEKGLAYPIAFNAANEVAVSAFFDNKISFLDISKIVGSIVSKDWSKDVDSLEKIFSYDEEARRLAKEMIKC